MSQLIPSRVLEIARQKAVNQYLNNPRVTAVGIGIKKVAGKDTGQNCIVIQVDSKVSVQRLLALGEQPLPAFIDVDGVKVPTDIQVDRKPTVRLLRFAPGFDMSTQASSDHVRCFNAPIPGGPQIAPRGKNWVGTLGCAVRYKDLNGKERIGALTNGHVTALDGVGNEMLQPGPGSDYFAITERVVGIRFGSGYINYIDAAAMNTWREGGIYGGGTHTVKPTQLGIGDINPEPMDATLRLPVWKSGRTTGVTTGYISMLDVSTYVGYDQGTARFDRQLYVKGDNGDFSAGGDSGSLVLHRGTNRPVGLLFAGGDGNTVISPIKFVLEWCGGSFFAP